MGLAKGKAAPLPLVLNILQKRKKKKASCDRHFLLRDKQTGRS